MAGGTFVPSQGKVRPGVYINFSAVALDRIQSSERGIVTIPLALNWGPSKTFVSVQKPDDAYKYFGYDITAPEMLLVREILKRASRVLVYRPNEGTKATGTIAPLTSTAKYGGTRGNDIKHVISDYVLDVTKKVVTTFVGISKVDEQIAATVEELQPNDWVTFSGTGNLVNTAGTSLTGGTNGTTANSDYTSYFTAAETQFFNVIALPVDDSALKTTFVSFVKRLRDDQGKKIKGVLPNYKADYEGINNVRNGVILEDGTVLTTVQAVAWAAGAEAGAAINESNTYAVYEGAVDANPRLTHDEIVDALQNGEFVFVSDGNGKVRVEQDINSLTTFGQVKNKRFSKNRVIRVLDTINNDFNTTFGEIYMGKIDNSPDGQALLKDEGLQYLKELQAGRALQNVNLDTDFIINAEKSVGDEVWATIGAQPIDSMEKFFFDVRVR